MSLCETAVGKIPMLATVKVSDIKKTSNEKERPLQKRCLDKVYLYALGLELEALQDQLFLYNDFSLFAFEI